MKLLSILAAMCLSVVLGTTLTAQDQKQPPEWTKATLPGEHHKMLEPLVGKWNIELSVAGGQKSKGTSEFRWAMGKRFLIEETKAEMQPGETFEWMAIHGYDNVGKRFVFVAIDNSGTDIDQMTGQPGADKKSINYEGDLPDGRGGTERVKWIIHIDSNDAMRVEMFQAGGSGKDTKVLDIVGKRAT